MRGSRVVGVAALAALAVLAGPAAAQPVAIETTPARPDAPAASVPAPVVRPAGDLAGAPLPGSESGRIDPPETDSALRVLGRAVLLVPRLAIDAALMPIRGAVYVQDRYDVQALYYRVFYNADRTIGLYPTFSYATGLGLHGGAHFRDIDSFGDGETIDAEALTGALSGDSYHESLLVSIHSGNRLGRLQIGAESTFDRRPRDPFYGIGNADVAPRPVGLIDPRSDSAAVSTRYRYQELRAAAYAELRAAGALRLRATGAATDHGFERSTTGPAIDAVYAPSGLVGWGGFSNLYAELELRIDRRRRATLFEQRDLHGEGWLAAAALGRVHPLHGGAEFWRGSVELQQFIRISDGPRLLALRARGEAVSGSLADVPFIELPALGGGEFVRGYDVARFRDRVSALVSAEYVWSLARWFDAAIFVDAGRVLPSLSELDLDHVRIGYGAALEVFNDNSFLFEASVASSRDGAVFFNLSFNPVFDARPRWR
jgi:hypothetical protein